MTLRIYNEMAEEMADAAAVDIQATTTNNVFVRIYEGPRPAVNVAPSGTTPAGVLIAEYDVGATPFGATPAAVASGSGATHSVSGLPLSDDALAAFDFNANGGYGLIFKRDGTIGYTGSLGAAGSGADFEVTPLSGAIALTLTLTAASFTVPQS